MSVREQLISEHGIRVKGSQGNEKVVCPKCSHTRKKKTDPCLSVTIDGDSAVWNCHNCEWKGGLGPRDGGYTPKPKPKPVALPAQPEAYPKELVDYLQNERFISVETAQKFKLTCRRSSDGKDWVIGFPFFFEGECVNLKQRPLKEKRFQLEKGADIIFFNLDAVKNEETIYITEGEWDALALAECGITAVLSVPNGHTIVKNRESDEELSNGGRFRYLGHAEEILQRAKKVILAVDNDPTGEDLQYELARRIGKDKCWTVRWTGEKDANDVLKKYGKVAVMQCLESASPYPIEGLYSVENLQKEVMYYFQNSMGPGDSTGYENLDMYYTPKRGCVTVVTGTPGTGKSEFLDSVLLNMATNLGRRTVFFSPENVRQEHIIKMAEKITGLPARQGSTNRMREEQLVKAMMFMQRHFEFIVNPKGGKASLDWILERARAAVLRFGVDYIVLDPYNWIHKKLTKEVSETEWVGELMTTLKAFADLNGVHIFIVAHPAKPDKDNTTGLSMYGISGSANWVNMADYGIILERAPGYGAQPIAVHIKKIRSKYSGQTGVVMLDYDRETGTYTVPDQERSYEEIFHPKPKSAKKKKTEDPPITTDMFGKKQDEEIPF